MQIRPQIVNWEWLQQTLFWALNSAQKPFGLHLTVATAKCNPNTILPEFRYLKAIAKSVISGVDFVPKFIWIAFERRKVARAIQR